MIVHNAFFHDNMQKEIYMKHPLDFFEGREGKIYRLQKSYMVSNRIPNVGLLIRLVHLNSMAFANLT